MVKANIKFSDEMQKDLCGKRLVGNFLEWCDTPRIRKPGFSTTRGCWLFDEIEEDVRFVVPHADNNVHLSVPHPAGDPVTAANKDRVLEFLRTTFFFDNATTLWCQFAAICLTLRGVTIVRAFITVGPGGVGQNLNTCLIANLFGGSHGFMDMNVLYRGRASKADRPLHGQGKHLGSHIFTTSDMKTLVVLFFFRSNRAHRVILKSSSPARRPPAPTNGSAKTFTRRW